MALIASPFDLIPIEIKRSVFIFTTESSDKEDLKQTIINICQLNLVCSEFYQISQQLIIHMINKKKWTLLDMGLESPYDKMSKMISFLEIFGHRLTHLPLEGLELSPREADVAASYCPHVWSIGKELKLFEHYVSSLDPASAHLLTQRFREASQERPLDICENGIMEWVEDLEMTNKTRWRLEQLNNKISTHVTTTGHDSTSILKEFYFRNFCREKPSLKKRYWKLELSNLEKHLKTLHPIKILHPTLIKKFLYELDMKGVRFDFSTTGEANGMRVSDETFSHLERLEKSVSEELSNAPSLLKAMVEIAVEFKKLTEIL